MRRVPRSHGFRIVPLRWRLTPAAGLVVAMAGALALAAPPVAGQAATLPVVAQTDHASPRSSSSTRDAYVLATGANNLSTNLSLDECLRLREKRAGDFLWFRRSGKTYEVSDAATLEKAVALFATLRTLEPEQESLRRRQEALSEREQELDREQEELERQMDRLSDADADVAGGDTDEEGDSDIMVPDESAPATEEERADLERELRDLQRQKQALEPRQRELAGEDRELEKVERSIDAREEKLENEAEAKLWKLIDAAIQSGIAKPSAP